MLRHKEDRCDLPDCDNKKFSSTLCSYHLKQQRDREARLERYNCRARIEDHKNELKKAIKELERRKIVHDFVTNFNDQKYINNYHFISENE